MNLSEDTLYQCNKNIDLGLFENSLNSIKKKGITLTDKEVERYKLSWEGFTTEANKEIKRLHSYGASEEVIINVFSSMILKRIKKSLNVIGFKRKGLNAFKKDFRKNDFVIVYTKNYINFLNNQAFHSELKGGE